MSSTPPTLGKMTPFCVLDYNNYHHHQCHTEKTESDKDIFICIGVNMRSFDANSMHSDRLAAKLARKESLSTKLEQRPGRQELIDRNILYQVID